MIAEAKLDIPIFTLDTGRLCPETYDLIDRTSKHYGLPIHAYFPATEDAEEMVARDGISQSGQLTRVTMRRASSRTEETTTISPNAAHDFSVTSRVGSSCS